LKRRVVLYLGLSSSGSSMLLRDDPEGAYLELVDEIATAAGDAE
jgi:hypothetical protein